MNTIMLRLSAKAYAELDHRLDIIESDGYDREADEIADWQALVEINRKTRYRTGAVTLAVTLSQMKLIRDELDYSLGFDLDRAEQRAITLAINRIDFYLKLGHWPKPKLRRNSASPWPPSVRAEAERIVKETIRHCCRVARRKEHDLGLPSDWKPTLKVSWNQNRLSSYGGKSSRGLYGGHGGVSLALTSYVPRTGEGGGAWREYRHIAREPVIGDFKTTDWRNVVRALVAHEVAHAIQLWLNCHGRGRHRRIDYRRDHGEGFQKIYAMLRHAVVNPLLKAEAGQPAAVTKAADRKPTRAAAPKENRMLIPWLGI